MTPCYTEGCERPATMALDGLPYCAPCAEILAREAWADLSLPPLRWNGIKNALLITGACAILGLAMVLT